MESEMSGSARIILMKYLEELGEEELKKFKFMLKEYSVKQGYSQIPAAKLEKADYLDIINQMFNHYEEDYALEIAGELLSDMNRRDLYDKFKCDLEKCKNVKLQDKKDHKKNYMSYIKKDYSTFKDPNGRIGGDIKLKERYTKLLIIKEHRLRAEREHEIMSTGRKHLEIMAQLDKLSYSSIEALFDPEKDGHVPRTVVLQGAAGIGKTMTARMMMLDWASGELFQGRFEYAFYINCREINHLRGPQTIAKILSRSCPGMSLPMMEAEPEKLLFIIDGFDEVNLSIDLLTGDPGEEAQEDNTLMSLIRRCFPQSYIVITTRPTALEKLEKCVMAARFAEILGFSEDDRKEYFIKFFQNESQWTHAFKIVKENDTLFTMCVVPIVCWIVCTVIKEQMEKKKDPVCAVRTMASVYMLFLSRLLMQQRSDSVQPVLPHPEKLCALAKDGVWEQKILFDDEDLINGGLEISAVQSLFLKTDRFQIAIECENYYSFIHLSFQEFFAAMFYALRENEAPRGRMPCNIPGSESNQKGQTENPQRDVISLLEASRTQKHLMLTVRFLFGLLNKETQKRMEKRFKWKISSDIKTTLLKWIQGEIKPDFTDITNDQMELLHCLYEIQDEEFVKSATVHVTQIGVTGHPLGRAMTAMDFRALGFCLINSPGVELVVIGLVDISPADLRSLTPGLMTCSKLRLGSCSLIEEHCADLASVLSTNFSLTELCLSSNKPRDSGVVALCEGLKHPECKIQKLELRQCFMTALCCADLSSVLSTNSSLTELDLWGNKLMDSGVRALCEGLKRPGCKIQKLVLGLCSLTASCCADLSSVLSTNSTLTELDLSYNELMDSGVRALCEGLKHPGCRIQTLYLWYCSLTASCCADLSSVLSKNSSLTELDLRDNVLMDSGVRALCEGLKHPWCKIQKLKLGRCSLTASCCADLSSVLSTNSSLTELNLTWNELMDSGVRALCEGLKHPECRIQTLVLQKNKLTDASTEALCSALRTNRTMQSLQLTGNRFTQRSRAEFLEFEESGRITIQ